MLLYRSAFVEQTFHPLGMGIIVERKNNTIFRKHFIHKLMHFNELLTQ